MMLAREPIIPRTDKPFKVCVAGNLPAISLFPSLLVNANEMLLYKLYGLQTSIVFSLEEGPGQLFKALAVFALRKINLTKVLYLQQHHALSISSTLMRV